MAFKPYSAPGFLPADNPISQWVAPRRNALLGFGAGMLSNNWSDIGKGTMQGMALDRDYALEAQEMEQEEATKNATVEWLQSQGYDDLVQMAQATGDIGAAWSEGLKRNQPGSAPKPIEVNGQLVDPVTYEVVFDGRDPQSNTPSAPSGYQWVQGENGVAQLSFIPGGPADPALASQKPPTEAERKATALTTVTEQDAALLFGDGTNPGVFEALGGLGDSALQAEIPMLGGQPLAGLASSEFKVAKDAISNIAQSYMYAMSGATAPPEEVKKIADMLTPGPWDSPEQKAAKKNRLLAMYEAIKGAQGNAANVGDGWEVVGVQ